MKDYLRIVAGYLTGWVIAQTLYNRVIRHWRDSDWVEEKRDIARRVAVELERRERRRQEVADELESARAARNP